MSWSIGYDANWNRDVGYGVPAYCDHPDCDAEIDRGLSYVCGGDMYGGDEGCGLFFCEKHLFVDCDGPTLCARCSNRKPPFEKKPDHPRWLKHKATDESWAEWRKEQAAKGIEGSNSPATLRRANDS
jgi:hypothetical protein